MSNSIYAYKKSSRSRAARVGRRRAHFLSSSSSSPLSISKRISNCIMVVIHLNNTATDQFLVETTCGTSNNDLINNIVRSCHMASCADLYRGHGLTASLSPPHHYQVNIWNKRMLAQRLAGALPELGKHGPAKTEEAKGLDEVTHHWRFAHQLQPSNNPPTRSTAICRSRSRAAR